LIENYNEVDDDKIAYHKSTRLASALQQGRNGQHVYETHLAIRARPWKELANIFARDGRQEQSPVVVFSALADSWRASRREMDTCKASLSSSDEEKMKEDRSAFSADVMGVVS
jgi:hypothetical protein